jgi:hypothetical protein
MGDPLMKKSHRCLAAVAAAVAALSAGYAGAQYTGQLKAPAPVATVNPDDLIPLAVHGVGAALQAFATPGQISSAASYVNLGAATTGNTYTFAKGQMFMLMQPAGTLAAVTLVTEANPSDGQRECFVSTQTTTSLTWNASTGQTMGATITAGVANTPICILYTAATATWLRT